MQDRNLRILVVDYDDVDREQMVRLLKRIGPSLQFAEARSLEEARACLKTFSLFSSTQKNTRPLSNRCHCSTVILPWRHRCSIESWSGF